MSTAFFRSAVALVAILLLPPAAGAQSAGSITGTVKDSSGGVLPGATVTVTNPAEAVAETTQTSTLGMFLFPQLPPGPYAIKVELSGFKTVEKTNVILSTSVPGIGNVGPYPRNYLRNPGFNNHDLSLFKNFPFGSNGHHTVQLRLEAFNVFNVTQFSGVNRTTNLATQNGATGPNVFNNYTNLQITTNTRPAGSTDPLGQYFGEYNGSRDPRIIQLGVKMYF